MKMYPFVKCPKCNRELAADGEMQIGDVCLPTYQCPECVTRTKFLGETLELPLTFMIGPDGRAFDPADPDGEIDLTRYE